LSDVKDVDDPVVLDLDGLLLFDRLAVSIQDKIAVGIALISNDVLPDERRSEDTDTCLTLADKTVEVVLPGIESSNKGGLRPLHQN